MSVWQARDDTQLEPGTCALCSDQLPAEVAVAPSPADERSFRIVRCDGCGLLFTDPRPTPETMASYYESDYYSYRFVGARPRSHRLKVGLWRLLGLLPPPAKGSATGPGVGLVRRLMTGWRGVRAAWLLPAPWAGARFLDVGCGAGERLELARELGWETHGVDVGQAAVRAAAERGHRAVVANAEALPWAAGSFDYVNLSHVLEHLYDPLAGLKECRRLLHSGAVAQITVPNAADPGAARFGPYWYPYDVPRHLYHFTADSLRQLAGRAGLRVVRMGTLADRRALPESQRAAGEKVAARFWSRFGGGKENLDVWCRRD